MKYKNIDIDSIIQNPNIAKNLKIVELVDFLKFLSDKYYNSNESIVPDNIYDTLVDILKVKSPKNKFLSQIGSPIKDSKLKVKLPYAMPSLDKFKPSNNLLEPWLEEYLGPYYLSDKLDGISGLLCNIDNEIKLYTRGDGLYGQDISELMKYIKIQINIPNNTIIRGELIMSKNNFIKINNNDQFKNARNTVAGLVNSKTISKEIANVTEFIAYNLIQPSMKYVDQLKFFKKYKINTVYVINKKKIDDNTLIDIFNTRRNESSYEIDGIVVTDDSTIHIPLKNVVENPKYSFAFKMQLDDQKMITKVIDVEWECSKYGYIKPKIKIEPVKLVGVTITYITAFNAKYVIDNKIGNNSIVEIIRSGDVIPHINKVIKMSDKPILPPFKYKWNNTKVDIIIDDEDSYCKDIISIKKIDCFFSSIGVKYLSEGIITKLYHAGYNNVFKIIKRINNRDELYNIDGLGKRSIDKIFDNIVTSMNNLTLDSLMYGSTLFGRGFGKKRFKEIIKYYPNLINTSIKVDDIIKIDGFDNITAKQFIDNFNSFKIFYKKLGNIYDISYINNIKQKKLGTLFANNKIVFSGFRNEHIKIFIEDNGGKVTDSISKNTNLLIYTDKTSKFNKAVELNVNTILLDDFKLKYKL